METSSSTMYWVIGGIVIASGVIAVVVWAFPNITEKIVDFMNTMLNHAQKSVDKTYGDDSSTATSTKQ